MGDFKINEKTVFSQSGSAEPSMGSTVTDIPAAGVIGVLPVGVTGGSGLSVGGLISMQVITTIGSSTWTRPSGVTLVKVIVIGGGGGGAGASYYRQVTGGGGQAGGCSIAVVDVSGIATVSVTVGIAGTAGPVVQYDAGAAGGTGGTSSFGSHASATGGQTGSCYETYQPLSGVGSGGDINFNGGSGSFSRWTYSVPHTGTQYRAGGEGGSSYLGGGGSPANSNSTAIANAGYGGGGGGGWNNGTSSSKAGGAGGQGVVIVEEYS